MQPSPQHIEKELLLQVAGDNETAFRQLFDTYSGNLYGVAFAYTKSKETAQELVQDIFLKVWQKRQSLPAIERFDNYLYIAARNYLASWFRKKSKDREFARQLMEQFRQNNLTPEEALLFKESQQLIHRAVGQLTEQQRMVYELSRNEGLRPDEIAGRLGISRNTARNHLYMAMQSVRAFLKEHAVGILFWLCLEQLRN